MTNPWTRVEPLAAHHDIGSFGSGRPAAAVAYTACRTQMLVADAADETLVPFYERMGMRRVPNSRRLVALLSKISPR